MYLEFIFFFSRKHIKLASRQAIETATASILLDARMFLKSTVRTFHDF